MLDVSVATPADVPDAVAVWVAANVARGLPPSTERKQRVDDKLRAAEACVVVGRAGARTVAMALAEPGCADDGAGEPVPGRGHVSMVFVHPDSWGRGLGTALMAGLHDVTGRRGWTRLSVWTRKSNQRAFGLYTTCGYRPTGRTTMLRTGEQIVQLERRSEVC